MHYEQPDNNGNNIFVYMFIAMTAIIFVVVGLMFLDNYEHKSSFEGYQLAKERALEQRGIKVEVNSSDEEEHKPTSDELDIWNLPATGRTKTVTKDDSKNKNEEAVYGDASSQTIPPEIEEQLKEKKNSTQIEGLNFQKNGHVITAYRNGKVISKQGVILSWKQGSVNMKRLKNGGCDFVMLEIGSRGYCSGKIVMDDTFQKNLEEALATGLKVGIIFTSNAVTKDEVLEEADTLLTAVRGYTIDYPVVLKFEEIEDDISRTDGLTKEERTDLAIYFANEVLDSGLNPCIAGSKTFLEEKIDLSELKDCKIMLSQPGDQPELENEVSIWQYGEGMFQGVTNKTNYLMYLE